MKTRPKNVIETDCLGDELLELCVRADDEAGSIVLHGHDMNEKEKNNEEADDAAAHRGEKNHTQRREATIDRSEQADSKIRNQIYQKKSAHYQDKERERRSHHVTERNCHCLWGIPQQAV